MLLICKSTISFGIVTWYSAMLLNSLNIYSHLFVDSWRVYTSDFPLFKENKSKKKKKENKSVEMTVGWFLPREHNASRDNSEHLAS